METPEPGAAERPARAPHYPPLIATRGLRERAQLTDDLVSEGLAALIDAILQEVLQWIDASRGHITIGGEVTLFAVAQR